MTCGLNEDDIGELKSLKYKIKSCLEHPNCEPYRYWGCMLDIEKISKRFEAEGKEIPESDEFLDLADIKMLASRLLDVVIEEVEKRS